MSEEVFEDTPFAGYLKHVGAEDWGIEDSEESEESDADVVAAAARSRPAAASVIELRPLLLTDQISHTRRERFRGLLRSALSQKLSSQETRQFLEQFRYTTMSSDLLQELPLYTSWSAGTDERRRALLFNLQKPWTILKTTKSQWLGGGGCVVAISVLLHWRSRHALINEKSQIALIVMLLIFLYLFATARRRLLRSLRAKSLVFMEEFILSAKQFDGDVVRALRALQELEVVGAGFAPFGKPMQQVRGTQALGKKLRSVLTSSLHLITEAYVDAMKDCVGIGSLADIEQFYEMFGLPDQQANFDFEFSRDHIGFKAPSNSNNERLAQVSELKHTLRKAHFTRRVFMCCILAAPSTGECRPDELETWTVLTDHLLNCGQLAHQLSNLITKERLNPTFESLTDSPAPERLHVGKNAQPGDLIGLAASVRHLNARLELLQSAALSAEEYHRHETAIDLEVSSLNEEWQRLRVKQGNNRSGTYVPSSSPTMVDTPRSEDMSTFVTFSAPDLTDSATEVTDDSIQPTIWESVVPSIVPPRSSLSRDERIRLVHESREVALSAKISEGGKPNFVQRSALANELNNVFLHRQQ